VQRFDRRHHRPVFGTGLDIGRALFNGGVRLRRVRRAALARYPFRLNALLGAARSAAASGDHAAATGYAAQLATLAGKGDRVGLAEEIARFRH
jgi:hypothetical protein